MAESGTEFETAFLADAPGAAAEDAESETLDALAEVEELDVAETETPGTAQEDTAEQITPLPEFVPLDQFIQKLVMGSTGDAAHAGLRGGGTLPNAMTLGAVDVASPVPPGRDDDTAPLAGEEMAGKGTTVEAEAPENKLMQQAFRDAGALSGESESVSMPAPQSLVDPQAPAPGGEGNRADSLTGEIVFHTARDMRAEPVSGHSAAVQRMPHLDPREIMRQITEKTLAAESNHIEITLTPEELGKVRIVMTPGDTPSVTVYSDNRETLELLRRNADMLTKELRDTGFSGASLSFSDGESRPSPQFQAGSTLARDSSNSLAQSNPTQARPATDRQLDIRI